MHNFELEVLPQVAFKLPKTTDKVLILDKLMLVQIGKNTLKLVSAHHAEITIINTVDYNKTKEDPVMQTFVLPRFGFCVLYFLSILSDFFSRGKLTQKWQEPKAEQFAKSTILGQWNWCSICWIFKILKKLKLKCWVFTNNSLILVKLFKKKLAFKSQNINRFFFMKKSKNNNIILGFSF